MESVEIWLNDMEQLNHVRNVIAFCKLLYHLPDKKHDPEMLRVFGIPVIVNRWIERPMLAYFVEDRTVPRRKLVRLEPL
jgi:hypothetical protein